MITWIPRRTVRTPIQVFRFQLQSFQFRTESVSEVVHWRTACRCVLNLKELLVFKNQEISHKIPAFWLLYGQKLPTCPELRSSCFLQSGPTLQQTTAIYILYSFLSTDLTLEDWTQDFQTVLCLGNHLIGAEKCIGDTGS